MDTNDTIGIRNAARRLLNSPGATREQVERMIKVCENAGYDGWVTRLKQKLQSIGYTERRWSEKEDALAKLTEEGLTVGSKVIYHRTGEIEATVMHIGNARVRIKHDHPPRNQYDVNPEFLTLRN